MSMCFLCFSYAFSIRRSDTGNIGFDFDFHLKFPAKSKAFPDPGRNFCISYHTGGAVSVDIKENKF